MKKLCILPLLAALAFFVSCQKQQSEEEKKAEVERQVQERLATERQADEKQRLAQQQAELEAREKALAAKEAAAVAVPNVSEETPMESPVEAPQTVRTTREVSETRSSASYGTFYRKLEPHGAWRETSDYGYVWQPREAEDRSWRPYTDGRWVYTDAGWTWISEEPFGWATYHYGRWVRLRRVGWVWVPGEEWAPAWVSWRTSKDYVGWAPLPPEARFDRKSGIRNWSDNHYDIGPDHYSFVPENEFGSRRIRRAVVPVERNITIVIGTTNVTNITYVNTTIVNQGPNYEELRSRSREPIERYRLERQVTSDTGASPTVRGEVLVVSAPAITTVPGVDRPQTVKETLTETAVEKTWAAETDRPAAERARAKMKEEAAPPPDAPSKTFVKPRSSTTSTTPPPAATAAPISASPMATPKTMALATPVLPTPTPAPITPASPKSASPIAAPAAPTTPLAISTPTPKTSSPVSAPTAGSTVPALSTPSVPASPSARPRQPIPPQKSSPVDSAKPSASPEIVPPQTTPRQLVPAPLNTPAARANSTPPTEAIVKPSPRHDLAPKPVVPPRVTQPPPVATPPARSSTTDPSPPNETKPVVRQTPPAVRIKPPADATAIPSASTMPAAPSEDRKANPSKSRQPESVDDEKPGSKPTGSPTPPPQ